MTEPAVSAWISPRLDVEVAVSVLRSRIPRRLTYIAASGETMTFRLEPGPKPHTITVVEEDAGRRDVIGLISFAPTDGDSLILFACPQCNHGADPLHLLGLNPDGQIVAQGPRCSTCARLFDADGRGPVLVDGVAEGG